MLRARSANYCANHEWGMASALPPSFRSAPETGLAPRLTAEKHLTERVDDAKTVDHLPMAQVFGVHAVAAESPSGSDDGAVPK